MASFFSNLFDKIQNIFKTKKLDDNITDFQRRMDLIITDLILPYAQPQQQVAEKDRFRDLITLLNPKQCNKIAITMSNNLDKNYTKLQLEQFASNILVGRERIDCTDETCSGNSVPSIDNKDKKVSKKEICNAIAIHYVKILNLISAVLTAVNPMDNICLNRLRNLLTIISEDEQKGISGICDPIANVVKQSVMHEPGFKELLMLYYYHLMQDTETEEEKTNVRNQYQILVKTLSNLLMFVDPSFKESPEMDAMVARELSEMNEDVDAEDDEDVDEEDEDEDVDEEDEDEKENNEDLENLEQASSNSVKLPEVSANNIANIRKNISNFKANENAKLNSIISKIEGLNQIIANIQSNTKDKTMEPAPTINLAPAPSTLEPASTTMNQASATSTLEPASTAMIQSSATSTLEPASTTMNLEPAPSTMNLAPAPSTTNLAPAPSTLEQASPVVTEDLPETDRKTDSETESEYDDDDDDENEDEDDDEDEDEDDEDDNDDDLLDEIKDTANTTATAPSIESSSSGMPTTSTESLLPKTETTNTVSEPLKTSTVNLPKSTNSQSKEINDLLKQINATQKGGANNENNENNEKTDNEKMMNTSTINNTINTKELKTNNTLLDKFLEFVDFYANIDKIDPKIIEIVNTAFKTYDKFSNETQMEADLRITEDDFDNFCINNINDNAQIPITLNDPRLAEYLKIYKDLKSVYLDNCEYLLTLLEKQVLVKEKSSDTNTAARFTLREISYADLAALETDVRNRLVNMYAQCQQNYQAGLKALFSALKEPQN